MTAEWVTAFAKAGTFLVIAASTIAALLRLRHMRSVNQIAAYNECRETMESADFRTAKMQARRKRSPPKGLAVNTPAFAWWPIFLSPWDSLKRPA